MKTTNALLAGILVALVVLVGLELQRRSVEEARREKIREKIREARSGLAGAMVGIERMTKQPGYSAAQERAATLAAEEKFYHEATLVLLGIEP